MIAYKVQNKVNPIELSKIKLEGSVADQMNIFFENRIFSDFAKTAVYRETLDAFRDKLDGISEEEPGLWSGEFWGKWIISACRVAKYTSDPELKSFLNNAALELIDLADEDGYIGTYSNSRDIFPRDPEKTRPNCGWGCMWNWNLWCRKYTLWGLLEIYMLTGDKRVLDGAVRHADKFISDMKEQGCKPYDTGTFNGLPTGSVLKPMLILYRITEDEKYLDFAIHDIADDWEREDGRIPNIISNALANKPVHEWYPNSNLWAKAYEMMSSFDGIIELYRITGEERYLRATKNFYDNIKKYEFNAVLGMSANDQFFNAANYQNNCTEPCDVIHWMRLSSELFAVTGDIKYMNDMEESFYSPFLAASYSDGKWGARTVRTSGRQESVEGQSGMKYNHCCVNNMPRGYMNFAESMMMSSCDTLYINMYTDFEANSDFANVKVSGDYLSNGKANISLQNSEKITLKLRIPEFSRWAKIIVDTKEFDAACGKYFSLALEKGEHSIDAMFDMNPRIVDFPGSCVEPEEQDYVSRRFIGQKETPIPYSEFFFGRRATLHYGPLLLTRSKKCGNTEREMFEDNTTVCGKGYTAKVEPIKANGTRVKFNVTLEGEEKRELVMCDYATGTNEYSLYDTKVFSIWI